MLRFIFKRLGQMIIVLFFVILIAFSLIRMAPGSPARMLLPDSATEEQVREMEIKLGLDKPLYVQFFRYVADVAQGNLGVSIIYKIPVARIIGQRFPYTLRLTLFTVILGCSLAIPLGIIAGSNRGRPTDFFAMFFALLGQSMSPVWLAVFNVFVFSVWLGIFPALGTGGPIYYILPVLTLGYPMAAEITRIGRSGMIDTLGEDYITATYAKGVSRNKVNWKYAFKNALIPIVTLVGIQIGTYLSGTVVVETVFSWSGIGQLLYQAIGNRDYALVQSLLLISAVFFTVINLIVDIINSFIDPRIVLK
jgi:peptide/nickel transport system permease protein